MVAVFLDDFVDFKLDIQDITDKGVEDIDLTKGFFEGDIVAQGNDFDDVGCHEQRPPSVGHFWKDEVATAEACTQGW